MRWMLVLLVGCGAPPAPKHASAPRAAPRVAIAPVPAPVVELTTFSKPGTLYMLAVTDGKARCQPWEIDPEAHTIVGRDEIAMTKTTVSYDVTGTQLHLHDFVRTDGDEEASTTCESTLDVREADDALVIDRAKWFRTEEACEGALATHARVALDLGCAFEPTETEAVTTRPRFERILARGGVMFSIVPSPTGDLCQRVTFKPEKRDQGFIEGDLSYPIVESGVKGTETYSYELIHGGSTITLLGPSSMMEDGSGRAYGCGGQNLVQLFADHVEIAGALYYTQASCRAAISRAAETASWYPATEDEDVAQQLGTPAIGGC